MPCGPAPAKLCGPPPSSASAPKTSCTTQSAVCACSRAVSSWTGHATHCQTLIESGCSALATCSTASTTSQHYMARCQTNQTVASYTIILEESCCQQLADDDNSSIMSVESCILLQKLQVQEQPVADTPCRLAGTRTPFCTHVPHHRAAAKTAYTPMCTHKRPCISLPACPTHLAIAGSTNGMIW